MSGQLSRLDQLTMAILLITAGTLFRAPPGLLTCSPWPWSCGRGKGCRYVPHLSVCLVSCRQDSDCPQGYVWHVTGRVVHKVSWLTT